jgi:hypothetical protein
VVLSLSVCVCVCECWCGNMMRCDVSFVLNCDLYSVNWFVQRLNHQSQWTWMTRTSVKCWVKQTNRRVQSKWVL